MSANTVNTALTLLARDTAGEVAGSPADTLRAAAAYLADYGWYQGGLYTDPTQPCPPADVAGAIRAVVYGYPNPAPVLDGRLGWHVDMALAALADYLAIPEPDPDLTLLGWLDYAGHAVTAWNDNPTCTEVQVIAAMHAAADSYDALTSTAIRSTSGGTR